MALSFKRPETTVPLCLDGALYAEWQDADAELVRQRTAKLTDSRLNDPVHKLASRVTELQKRIEEETATFTIRGLPREEWAEIVAANPKRDGNEVDKVYGFNADEVSRLTIPLCIVKVTQGGEPVEFDPKKDWDSLAADMTDSQYDAFWAGVLTVNKGRNDLPFSLAASLEMQNFGKN